MKSNWIVVLCLLACLMLPSCGPHMYKTMRPVRTMSLT